MDQHAKGRIADARRAYPWAVEIVRKRFSAGLESICDPRFLSRRYEQFLAKNDPIYVDLLQGMEDERLSRTFVSYWTIAHTLATQSRFWLEDSVAEIILYQVNELETREATHVFSQSMLSDGYLKRMEEKRVSEIGEYECEHLSDRTPWRPTIKTSALETVDLLVGQQEREPVEERKPFEARGMDDAKNKQAVSRDMECLDKIAVSFRGEGVSEITLQCNLLVIEPDKLDGQPHAWAFRFVNPRTLSAHPSRRQERANILRLHALLVQEKILRDPRSIRVAAAELLPRHTGGAGFKDRYPTYFSSLTYWSTERVWEFIGVPFEVVSAAILDVAKEFRERLKASLRALLPDAKEGVMRKLLKSRRTTENDITRGFFEEGN
jgi:hypothetical protein